MFTVECKVGRLIEIRVTSLRTVADADRYSAALRGAYESAPGRLVGCADLRESELFPPDVADKLVPLLTSVNTKFERIATLLPHKGATFQMQVDRLVRAAENPSRRTFREPLEAHAWLSVLLTTEERRRLTEFLNESR
jgi:hypothetical protein